ncbi:DUF4097 family beta strand repeat-containing protein [Occultella gossypii]|uniref:DUF4097 family beta strand repeat protein n=1 Tax=Occultella gossypii TaxID=2800820 RepID=A0ABS7S7K3_9MICO|nr:DUF4097 family beta strand repeat-containing protein [Occultella gossypii]MBZ2196338.1 DUF4097 family beta strand repeat protein [Occultella gossypii]
MAATSRIITGPESIEIGGSDGVTEVRVQLIKGGAEVVARAEPGLHIDVDEVDGAPLEVATDGGRLTIGYPSIGWEGWLKRLTSFTADDRARVRIAVGPGIRVTAATVGAAVSVADVAEDLTVNSASGPVRTERTTGSVTVRTASGPIVIQEHTGPANVTTATGTTFVGGAVPRLSVTTVSGDVAVSPTTPSSVVSVTGVSAAIAVTLAADVGLDLSVHGVSAPVVVDGVDRRGGSGPSSTSVSEPRGAGTSFVKVSTVTGSVSVVHDVQDVPEGDAGRIDGAG